MENYNNKIEQLKEDAAHDIKIMNEISGLKLALSNYDYIGIKIATGAASVEEYTEQIKYCQTLRDKINELETQIIL